MSGSTMSASSRAADVGPAPIGTALRTLVAQHGATRILLIGTGVSATALSLAPLLPPDARFVVLDADPTQAAELRARLAEAGCTSGTTVIAGVAARYLHKLAGPFDLIVVDAGDENTIPRMDRVASRLAGDGTIAVARPDGTVTLMTRQTPAVAAGHED